MKISIWNLYYRLSYPNKIPLVKDGSPTIQGVRWIVSKDLNPDMVYIGEEEEFFADIEGNTIIVHRNDMILVQNAEPGEVFNGPVDKVIYKPRFHAIIPARRDRR